MADVACVGIWLNNKLDNDDDGNFAILELAGFLMGLHFRGAIGSQLRDLSCNGTTIGFKRTDAAGREIEYYNGAITQSDGFYRIDGKFRIDGAKPERGDDWTAEKPT